MFSRATTGMSPFLRQSLGLSQSLHFKAGQGETPVAPFLSKMTLLFVVAIGSSIGTAAAIKLMESEQPVDSLSNRRISSLINMKSIKIPHLAKSIKIPHLEKTFLYNSSLSSDSFIPKHTDKNLFQIGGYSESLEQIADIVRYLQDPAEYTKNGLKAPKGVILHGPPGVGKTLIAESIAGHASASLIFITAAELSDKYVGSTEEKIRALFQRAREIVEIEGACVICIDEFESVAVKRMTSESSPTHAHYINSAVNQLLTLLSEDNEGIVVIATTNDITMLDPAVIRPGRLDKHIHLALPNREERKQILEIYLKNKSLDLDVSIENLAAISPRFSGAKLAAWVREANLCAIRDNKEMIGLKHFDLARSIITSGIPKKNISSPKQKRRTALHEAGHALVGHMLNHKMYKTSILPDSLTFGHTEWIPSEENISRTKEELLNGICIALAGRAAELIEGTPIEGCAHDIELAKTIAHHMVNEEGMGNRLSGSGYDIDSILEEQLQRAKDILQQNSIQLTRLIDALLEHHELFRADFLRVLEGDELQPNNNDLHNIDSALVLPSVTLGKKKTRVTYSETGEKEFTLPYTLDQIAKALGIDPHTIRKIDTDSFGKIFIHLKPSFKDHKKMKEISKCLREHDVENWYSQYVTNFITLEIYKDGIEDLYKYIEARL